MESPNEPLCPFGAGAHPPVQGVGHPYHETLYVPVLGNLQDSLYVLGELTADQIARWKDQGSRGLAYR